MARPLSRHHLTPDETDVLPPAQRPMPRFLRFVRPHWRLIGMTAALSTIRTLCLLALPLIAKFLIDDLLAAEGLAPETRVATLLWLLPPVLALMAVMLATHGLRIYLSGVLSLRVIIDLRTALFHHVQRLGLRFFEQRKTGVVISRLLDDVNLAQSFINTAISTVAVDSVSVVFAVSLLFYLDWRMTVLAILILPILAFQLKYFRLKLRAASRSAQEQHAKLTGNLYEKIGGIPLVLSQNAERREDRRAFRLMRNYFEARKILLRRSAAFHTCLALLTQCAPLLVFWYAAWRIISDPIQGVANPLTLGDLVAFMALLGYLLGPVGRFAELNLTITNAMAGVERVFQLFDVKPDVEERPGARRLRRPVRGDLRLENVSFAYREGQDVVRDVSLHAPPGKILALVGPSGHGKSTLVRLVARFYDCREGAVFIDGVNVRDVTLADLRSNVGVVTQEVFIFSGTVRENIAYGAIGAMSRVTDEAIVNAARAADAWEFIEALPQVLDTELGERGVKLSAGQRQRIALARLFLRNPPILLLDEATSALDSVSERQVQAALDRLMRGRTTVLVAHRLSTVQHADRIAVIHEGRVVEIGRHEELLELDGLYAKLHRKQFIEIAAREIEDEPVAPLRSANA